MRRDALTRMGPMHISPVVDFLARMLMCLFGGISLVAPIIVLVFVKDSLILTLVLTVVFVLIVVLVLPLVCRSSTPNEALLGATAAYAAVLVVFVANASVSVKGP
jgi:VIT1/CCC1 family predicted Fe2+/Mn2+ transporter